MPHPTSPVRTFGRTKNDRSDRLLIRSKAPGRCSRQPRVSTSVLRIPFKRASKPSVLVNVSLRRRRVRKGLTSCATRLNYKRSGMEICLIVTKQPDSSRISIDHLTIRSTVITVAPVGARSPKRIPCLMTSKSTMSLRTSSRSLSKRKVVKETQAMITKMVRMLQPWQSLKRSAC